MLNGNALMVGAGRYFQFENALEYTGKELKKYGNKPFVIGGRKALSASLDKIEASMRSEKLDWKVHTFSGYCSRRQISELAEKVKKEGASVILGVGGGRCIDTAKAVADVTGLRIVTVPTIAATCAAYSPLCVLYDDCGTPEGSVYAKNEAAAVIVDLDVIIKSPERLTLSGITDALAKFPEISYSTDSLMEGEQDFLLDTAHCLSRHTTKTLFSGTEQAISDIRSNTVSTVFDNTVYTVIGLTGIISGLANGSKQLALAHSFHDAICASFKPQEENFYHGELVFVGVLFQIAFNGFDSEQINRYISFAQKYNIPCRLSDIGIEPAGKNIDIIFDYLLKCNLFDNNDPLTINKLKAAFEIVS